MMRQKTLKSALKGSTLGLKSTVDMTYFAAADGGKPQAKKNKSVGKGVSFGNVWTRWNSLCLLAQQLKIKKGRTSRNAEFYQIA
jgi:hypothetical protein